MLLPLKIHDISTYLGAFANSLAPFNYSLYASHRTGQGSPLDSASHERKVSPLLAFLASITRWMETLSYTCRDSKALVQARGPRKWHPSEVVGRPRRSRSSVRLRHHVTPIGRMGSCELALPCSFLDTIAGCLGGNERRMKDAAATIGRRTADLEGAPPSGS